MDARGARALQPSRMRVATLPAYSMSAPVLPFEQLMFLMLDARGARALFAGHTLASRTQCGVSESEWCGSFLIIDWQMRAEVSEGRRARRALT